MNECPYCKKVAVSFYEKSVAIFNDDIKCRECGGNLSLFIGGNIYGRILLAIFSGIIIFSYLIIDQVLLLPFIIAFGITVVLTINYFVPLKISN